mgnify:CR=1 FL=1
MIISSPGRICLFGEHQDYLGLPVIAAAISLRIKIEGKLRSDLEVNIDLPDTASKENFSLEGDLNYHSSSDYFKSGLNVMRKDGFTFSKGFNCTVKGNIPLQAGTSSSSALVVSWINFLSNISDQSEQLSPKMISDLAYKAEVIEFDQAGGVMDQNSISYGNLVYIDTHPDVVVKKLPYKLSKFVLGDSLEKKDTQLVLQNSKDKVLEIIKKINQELNDFSLNLGILTISSLSGGSACEYVSFNGAWPSDPNGLPVTGNNATIAISGDLDLDSGDLVGAFYEANNEIVCGGLLIWDADATDQLIGYRNLISAKLSIHQRWISPDKAQAGISDTIDRARRFLMLAGSIGVVLAGVALALASHQFARGEILQVGLYKTWGIGGLDIRRLYIKYAILVGVIGSSFGLVVGAIVQEILIQLISDLLPVNLPPPSGKTWTIGFFTGMLCLVGFMMPSLWHLPALSALTVLRKDVKVKLLGLAYRGIIGVITIGCLLWYYSASLMVALAIFSAFVVITLATFIFGYSLLSLGKSVSENFGSVWRLAFANLWRRRAQSLLQVMGFSGAISLLMVMTIVRTSLIDEWQWQLADDTPNHFFINVAPPELEGVESLMASRSLENVGWYSMIRARIRAINGQDLTSEQRDNHESLRRELNLSWSDKVPEGNKVVSGRWWPEAPANDDLEADKTIPVSIEVDVANELGLNLGDLIIFSVGGLEFEARVANTRSVNWQKMTPNFYFLFPQDALLEFPHTNMTSVHIPSEEKGILNQLLREFPTLQVIELDKVIKRIRSIVSQVTHGLEVMTGLILTCGVLVMVTSVRLSMSERLHESAILRTLGSSRSVILGIQIIEFASIGLISGLLAALGAETSLALIQYFIFNLPLVLHPALWIIGPLFCMVMVAVLGVGYAQSAVSDSPLDLLRRL